MKNRNSDKFKPNHDSNAVPYSSAKVLHLKKIFQKLLALPELPQIDRWIAFELSQNKKFGSQDRKWYAEQLFFIIRHLYYILYSARYLNDVENFKKDINTPKKFWCAIQAFDFEEIYTTAGDLKTINDSCLKVSIPFWLTDLLIRRFSDPQQLIQFLNLQQKRPALWIRLNDAHKSSDVISELELHDFKFKISSKHTTLAILGSKSVYQLESFKRGLFEVQDYASQEIGYACAIKPGDYVWDVCAGGGGKTMQLASQLNHKGVVYATDIRTYKLDEIKRRAKRAQFFNIRTIAWDGKSLPVFPKEIQNKKGFNCVLVDAPCSASGTWRRHPDAKYKIDIEGVLSLAKIQYDILSISYQAVKITGTLVYATCSIFKEENEDVVLEFLSHHPEFILERQQIVSSPDEDSDFMFVAVMRREK